MFDHPPIRTGVGWKSKVYEPPTTKISHVKDKTEVCDHKGFVTKNGHDRTSPSLSENSYKHEKVLMTIVYIVETHFICFRERGPPFGRIVANRTSIVQTRSTFSVRET